MRNSPDLSEEYPFRKPFFISAIPSSPLYLVPGSRIENEIT